MKAAVRARPNIYIWRRLHAGDIIAEVTSNPGMGLWRVSAYRVNGRASEVAYIGKAFSLLTEAHQGADDFVRREFQHECQEGTCGRWLRWSRTEESEGTADADHSDRR